jgi:hypothetical protein
MICPMFSSSHKWNECKGEECHWWSQKYGRCAILGYLEAHERLSRTLEEIKNKMSPELFRPG